MTGASSSSSCTDCQSGKYSVPSASVCADCVVGKYQSKTGSASCDDCEYGKYSSFEGVSMCEDCGSGKFLPEKGASNSEKCTKCATGTFSNATAAAACETCGEGETSEEGSLSRADCDCKPTYTRDCGSPPRGEEGARCKPCENSQLSTATGCQSCPARAVCDGTDKWKCSEGSLLNNNECQTCPELSVCDGTGTFKCQPGSYLSPLLTDGKSTDRICAECPQGADCSRGTFEPKVKGSVWGPVQRQQGKEGILLNRIQSCPPGFALTRIETNPQADDCAECPRGSYNLAGSFWVPTHEKTKSPKSGILEFCEQCPRSGADCPGGSTVEAQEGWYKYEMSSTRRVEGAWNRTKVVVYECPVMSCSGNNTCRGGKTGVLCAYCPKGWALELNDCVKCNTADTSGASASQILFGCIVSPFLMLVLFLLGWRHVFPGNNIHKMYDKASIWLVDRVKQVVSFLSRRTKEKWTSINPTLAVQVAKVFFGSLQVLMSFTLFKVELPHLLSDALQMVQAVSVVLTLEVFSWPGLGCLTELDYFSRLAARTLLPLLMVFLMAVPPIVSWIFLRQIDDSDRERILEATRRLTLAKDTCLNNIFTFLFVVFPSSTLASMEAFSCRQVGGASYLRADLRLSCPTASDGLFWFSIMATGVWTVGIPSFTIMSMRRHGIHTMAAAKHNRAILSAMISRFRDDNNDVDAGRQSLAYTVKDQLTQYPNTLDEAEDRPLDLKKRIHELFVKLFPEHANCKTCLTGHGLPTLYKLVLQKLKAVWRQHKGEDLKNIHEYRVFKKVMKIWYQEIAPNLNSRVSLGDLRREFGEMGMGAREIDVCLDDFKKHVDAQRERNKVQLSRTPGLEVDEFHLDSDEFENSMLHVLNECFNCFSFFEILTLFHFISIGLKWEKIDITHPAQRPTQGRELINFQLKRALQSQTDFTVQEWVRFGISNVRKDDFIESGGSYFKPADIKLEVLADLKLNSTTFCTMVVLQVEDLCCNTLEFTGEESLETLRATQLQKLLHHPWSNWENDMDVLADIIEDSHGKIGEVMVRDISHVVNDPEAAENARGIKFAMTESQENTLTSVLNGCKAMCEVLYIDVSQEMTIHTLPDMLDAIRAELNSLRHDSVANMQVREHLNLPGSRVATSIKNFESQLNGWSKTVKEIFHEMTAELGVRLYHKGVINVPALAWDCSLGPEEETVTRRFGFLINAFQVSCWYWEVVDMYRKFLLTGLMVILYDGTPPHLVGALLTTFVFLLLHVLWHPYLNQDLNEFQRLTLITQFITVFGCIIYDYVGTLDRLHEIEPTQEDRDGSRLLELAIIFMNCLVIILWPAWITVKYLLGTKVSLRAKILDGFTAVVRFVTNTVEANANHLTREETPNQAHSSIIRQLQDARKSVSAASVSLLPRPGAVQDARIEEDTGHGVMSYASARAQSAESNEVCSDCSSKGDIRESPSSNIPSDVRNQVTATLGLVHDITEGVTITSPPDSKRVAKYAV